MYRRTFVIFRMIFEILCSSSHRSGHVHRHAGSHSRHPLRQHRRHVMFLGCYIAGYPLQGRWFWVGVCLDMCSDMYERCLRHPLRRQRLCIFPRLIKLLSSMQVTSSKTLDCISFMKFFSQRKTNFVLVLKVSNMLFYVTCALST